MELFEFAAPIVAAKCNSYPHDFCITQQMGTGHSLSLRTALRSHVSLVDLQWKLYGSDFVVLSASRFDWVWPRSCFPPHESWAGYVLFYPTEQCWHCSGLSKFALHNALDRTSAKPSL